MHRGKEENIRSIPHRKSVSSERYNNIEQEQKDVESMDNQCVWLATHNSKQKDQIHYRSGFHISSHLLLLLKIIMLKQLNQLKRYISEIYKIKSYMPFKIK